MNPNLLLASYFPDDMHEYQGITDASPTHPPGSIISNKTGGTSSRVTLSFAVCSRNLTLAGRERDGQRKRRIWTERMAIMNLTYIDRIHAVNYFDGERLRDEDDEPIEPLHLLRHV